MLQPNDVATGVAPPLARGTLSAWVLACRPRTLAAAVVPVAVGSAVAAQAGGFRLDAAIFALLAAMLIQIGTNLANDVFDFEQGADTAERLGPPRAVSSGLLSPGEVRRALVLVFGAATAFGVYLVWLGGWPIFAVGVASVAAGIGYTRGKRSLGYRGLGEVFVFLFFGIVAVAGTEWVEARRLDPLAIWAGVPIGALATALLVVNNLRDRRTDALAEKRTLVVRFGRGFGVAEITVLLAIAHAVPAALVLLELASPAVLATLALLPLSRRIAREAEHQEGRALNATLARTAQLLLLFGLVFAAALALWPVAPKGGAA